MRLAILLIVLLACGRDPSPSPSLSPSPSTPTIPAQPVSLAGALERLRIEGLGRAAEVIEQRVNQKKPKMRLTPDQGMAAATALLDLAAEPAVRELHAVMPRSTVELARAVRERDLPRADAVEIAAYLARVVAALDFQRLDTFDDNHSHVTGREWHQIDYGGEDMTWQAQQAHWSPRGVESFRKAAFIHAYFVGAEPMRHWARVYRPRGRMADVVR